MAADGRFGTVRSTRASAAFRAEEEHDRHRRWEEYLSRGYRNGLRRTARQGILRVRCELFVAAKRTGTRDAGDGPAAGTESSLRQRAVAGNCKPQPTAAGFQTRRRVFHLGEGFSADCIDES